MATVAWAMWEHKLYTDGKREPRSLPLQFTIDLQHFCGQWSYKVQASVCLVFAPSSYKFYSDLCQFSSPGICPAGC